MSTAFFGLVTLGCVWAVWRTIWWSRALRQARVITHLPRDPHGRAIDAYGWRFEEKGKRD